jgi:hypothetical protein
VGSSSGVTCPLKWILPLQFRDSHFLLRFASRVLPEPVVGTVHLVGMNLTPLNVIIAIGDRSTDDHYCRKLLGRYMRAASAFAPP